jgi:hypothetical protein
MKKLLEKEIDDWAPWIKESFEMSGGQKADEVYQELHRFFELTKITDEPLAMVNPKIDHMWHKLTECTEQYEEFCVSNYGSMIHHRPRTMATPVAPEAVRNFYRHYEAEYGVIPAIWDDGTSVDLMAYGRGQRDTLPVAAQWSGWPGRS